VTVSFRTSHLLKTFNSEKALVREYGPRNAKRIAIRMAVLFAAPNLAAVPKSKPDRCHPLKGTRDGQFAVDLEHPFRLVFSPDHDPVARSEDGSIDMSQVTAIKIQEVEDYH
jgi:proteic killer suppression protein